MEEIWKDIEGWEGLYKVSNTGKVWSERSCKNLKGVPEGQGYLQVYLCINGLYKRFVIHRLVAKAFIPNPANKPEVNHIDCDKNNNHVSNLEWVTPSENIRHAFRMGVADRRGEKHPSNKLTEKEVIKIRQLLDSGLKVKEVSSLFPVVKEGQIKSIKYGYAWRHLI